VESARPVLLALLVSLAVHGLLAVGLVAYLDYVPAPDVSVSLDLSSVELSFSEKTDETAAVAPMPPAPPPQERKPKTEKPPPEEKLEKPLPPDPAAPKFREPTEEPPAEMHPPPLPSTLNLQPAPQQARVDAPPQPKRAIKPEYPRGARQRGEQGDVTLEIRVSENGSVDAVEVVVSCGFAELDAAAVKAVRAARFTPAKAGNESVASTARLKLSFKLK